MITVTAARKVARQARQHGYFATGNQPYSAVWVRCPQCRAEVRTEPLWRQHETRVQALDRAMLDPPALAVRRRTLPLLEHDPGPRGPGPKAVRWMRPG